jgi:MarR family transcriptional regulator for hemolysin
MQQLSQAINGDKPDVCALEVLDGVLPAIWFIRRQMRKYRKGLSLPQFRALVLIDRHPAVCLSTIAEHLGASLPTVSRIVSGLVDRELVSRQECRDDRRQMALAITLKGREVLKSAWAGTQEKLAEELIHLNPDQRATVAEAMRLLKQTFGKVSLPASLIDGQCEASPSELRRARRSLSGAS